MKFASVFLVSSGSPDEEGGRKSVHLTLESRSIVNGRLHQLLTASGLSSNELADQSALPRTTVKDVLSGRTGDLSLGVMIHLAHGLGLRSIEELIAPLGKSQLRRSEFGEDVIR